MSESRTSLSFTATMPCELSPRTCAPEIAAYTVVISQPAMFSASSTACWIAATVASMLTTYPRRRPFEGAVPMPMISTPSSVTSPAMHAILVVPMSSPTMISEVFGFAIMGLLIFLGRAERDGDVIEARIEMDGAGANAFGVIELRPRHVERVHASGEAGVFPAGRFHLG